MRYKVKVYVKLPEGITMTPKEEQCLLARDGIPSSKELGSRGSLTYTVEPTEDTAVSLFSLSHGAGRKWIRSLCKGCLKDKYRKDEIHDTKLGSKAICHDSNLLYEEAPEAYKNIEHIIEALIQHGLCKVTATLRPLITFKA